MADLEQQLHECANLEAGSDIENAKWPIIAAVSVTACSGGSDLVKLYAAVTKDLALEKKKVVQRRIKEAILKTTMLYGTPKALSALLPLYDAVPEDEIDNSGPRYERLEIDSRAETEARGWRFFETLWTPASAESIRTLYMKHHKDMFLIWVKNILDSVISEDAILDMVETELCMTAALICSQNPVLAVWHSKGIVRQGGTRGDVQLAHRIAVQIAKLYGCDVSQVPSVESIDFDEVSVH